jgi:polysaccharide export outer membrane protein
MVRSILLACLMLTGMVSFSAGADTKEPAKELVQYVREAKQAGLNNAQIQANAVKAGWVANEVQDAIVLVGAAPAAQSATGSTSTATAPPQVPAAQTSSENPPAAAPATPDASGPAAPGGSTTPAGGRPAVVPQSAPGVSDDYQIGGGDVISISVWGEPSASIGGVAVRADGKISMPLVKELFVVGMTPKQLEKVLTEQLSEKIRAPDVTVIVTQANSQKIYILGGGAKREGPLPFTYGMTVMRALSEVGGLSEYAKAGKIYVLREENGRQFKLPFDYSAVLRGERMELNYPLRPGDILVVPNH